MAAPVRPTFLHRMFAVPLGEAPRILFPKDRCLGIGAFEFLASSLIILGLVAIHGGLTVAPLYFLGVLGIPLGIILCIAAMRFESRERLAKARKRRSECLGCGARLNDDGSRFCRTCTAATHST